MRWATIVPLPIEKKDWPGTGKAKVIVSNQHEIMEWSQEFPSAAVAMNFLKVAGWIETKASNGNTCWYEERNESTAREFVAIRGREHFPTMRREIALKDQYKIKVATWYIGPYYAFGYVLIHDSSGVGNPLVPQMYDPILTAVSPPGIKIDGIGCWFNEETAAVMAQHYIGKLKDVYGEELLIETVRAHIFRAVYGNARQRDQ